MWSDTGLEARKCPFLLSAAFFGVLVLLTGAAVVLTIVAIVLLSVVGVRLLLARGPAVCRRLDALPRPTARGERRCRLLGHLLRVEHRQRAVVDTAWYR